MIINYSNVTISRGDNIVLTDVDMTIEAGQFVYLTGVVGSGKTSLLRTIYGELDITDGQAEVLGHDMCRIKRRQLPALRRQLGIVFQDFRLLAERSVKQNLDFVLRATGWKHKDERNERIIQVLDIVGMAEKLNAMPYELSGGEQQRVCIARAILNSPALILADEATGNQDKESGIRTASILYSLAQQGTAVIMATHNDALIEQFPGIIYTCTGHTLRHKGHSSVKEETIPDATINATSEVGGTISFSDVAGKEPASSETDDIPTAKIIENK
ncbi:MAG: ATP-binding cassette domain-containing protein [Bacteroidaceae bacterium]|nr:ATP-binding cassette domain-containing protein [Bacteroidaceae bacterium]